MRALVAPVACLAVLVGCSGGTDGADGWTEDEVSFEADGLTIHGSYRHQQDGLPTAGAVLISESGQTDRNGDNVVAGPVGNMRQLAEQLAEFDVASLRYDKVGTGVTGLGRYADQPAEVGSAVYTAGARAALGFLTEQLGTDTDRVSAFGLGEGATHAMELAAGGTLESVGLLQPLAARYLDLITARVRNDMRAAVEQGRKTQPEADEVLSAWAAAVAQVRADGTVPAQPLPEGLGAIVNAGNAAAVAEADSIDPLAQAAAIPAATRVLLTCSDADAQASCADMGPLMEALAHTELTTVELTGVNHVLRDDPTDSVAGYAKGGPLSPQLVDALGAFLAQ